VASTTTLAPPAEPPSSSDPTTAVPTTVAPPESAPINTTPTTTTPPPTSTPATDPPTTSPPTTVDHATLCAELNTEQHAIEAQIAQVGQTYKNDPVTRDSLTKQLEAQKNAIEQQRRVAHC
jgi:hypothetical protein